MKEKNSREITIKKKRVIYSMLVAVCVLLLTAAIVLTVYFVSTGSNDVLVNPPVGEDPSGGDIDQPSNPSGGDIDQPSTPSGGDIDNPSKPSGGEIDNPSKPSGGEIDNPSKPSGGEDTVKYVAPLAQATCSVEYASIYTNVTMLGQIRKHMGVDFTASKGTAVMAIAGGTVTSVSMDAVLGNVITIDHGDNLVSCYRFVEPVEGLVVGQRVIKGQKIAEVAEAYGTEKHAGEHLHFEIKVGAEWDDPAKYFDITYEEK